MKTTGNISGVLAQKGNVIWSISPEATVFEAIQRMAEKNIGAVVVLENETLLGLISERDYTRKVALMGRSSKETLVKDIMTTSVVTVTPEHTVEECLRLMNDKRVRHLPVLEGGKLIGIVSIGNLVNWIISAQSETIHQLEDYITGKYPG